MLWVCCVTCTSVLIKLHFILPHSFGPYFVEPIIAGLDSENKPYVASTDLIGCPMVPSDFVVGGTSNEQLYGMCESLWKPDMVSPPTESEKIVFPTSASPTATLFQSCQIILPPFFFLLSGARRSF